MLRMGRLSMSHPSIIIFHSLDLFWGEGVHLSMTGADRFLLHLQQGLRSLLGFYRAVVFRH